MPRQTDATFKSEKNKQENQPIFLYTVFDYDGNRSSSSATATSANHLIDSTANFTASDVGKTIHNTTDDTYAVITARNSATDVTLSKNIMASGEAYDLEYNLYFAEWDANIVYDGITYTAFPITHDYIGEQGGGEIDVVKVRIGNVSRLIQSYLEDNDFRGKKASIKKVWANQLADTDAYTEDVYYIDTYTAGEKDAEFTLSSKTDILDVKLPTRKYNRNYCSWKFKSTECGYSGAETTCNKTKANCQARSNFARFGGFPSIPMRRLYVA